MRRSDRSIAGLTRHRFLYEMKYIASIEISVVATTT